MTSEELIEGLYVLFIKKTMDLLQHLLTKSKNCLNFVLN